MLPLRALARDMRKGCLRMVGLDDPRLQDPTIYQSLGTGPFFRRRQRLVIDGTVYQVLQDWRVRPIDTRKGVLCQQSELNSLRA